MQTIYFEKAQNISTAKRGSLILTGGFTKIAPSLSANLFSKILMRPFGRRKYEFKRLEPQSTKLSMSMGEIQVYYFEGQKVDNSKCMKVLLSHGWMDNSRRFETMIAELTAQGHSVWSLDHIGHGKSAGNMSHLFGFKEGFETVIQHIEQLAGPLDAFIAHSMGCVALMNLNPELLANKKKIMLSVPFDVFESMYSSVHGAGISKSVLTNLLEHVSKRYSYNWKNFEPKDKKEMIDDGFLFIHDRNDSVASFTVAESLVQSSEASFVATENLGHLGVFKDQTVIQHVSDFLKSA